MQLTTIENNRGIQAMKAMALALFPSLSWRHHGIGVLQGYVVEDVEPEVRLHIWAPQLLKPGMALSGDIHDHRFDLLSHVLCGNIGHEEIVPEIHKNGAWSMMELTHARAAKDSGYHGPTRPIEGKYTLLRTNYIIPEGCSYHYPAGRFHRSPLLDGVAVTCVEKHRQSDASARLLYPIDLAPIMAFGHEMDWSIIGPVMQAAREALMR
jgi:hypothetical protein